MYTWASKVNIINYFYLNTCTGKTNVANCIF